MKTLPSSARVLIIGGALEVLADGQRWPLERRTTSWQTLLRTAAPNPAPAPGAR